MTDYVEILRQRIAEIDQWCEDVRPGTWNSVREDLLRKKSAILAILEENELLKYNYAIVYEDLQRAEAKWMEEQQRADRWMSRVHAADSEGSNAVAEHERLRSKLAEHNRADNALDPNYAPRRKP